MNDIETPMVTTKHLPARLPAGCGAPGCFACEGHGKIDWVQLGRQDCHICVEPMRYEYKIREMLAEEATRLWKRDLGRGITIGNAETYIALAVLSFRDGTLVHPSLEAA